MSEKAEFHVMGQPFDGAPLHYTASGLDYVYLLNGFTVENDPDYGRIVTIDAVDDLHRAIGLSIVCKHRSLTGAEFRFLRKQMGLKQKDLAPQIGVDVQTVANYEKDRKIPATSDRLMRVFFVLWITPPDARADVVKKLTKMVQRARNDLKHVRHVLTCPSDDYSPASGDIVKQWQMNVSGGVCHV